MDKIAKQYLNEIKKRIPDGIENRDRYLSDIKAAIENDAEGKTHATYMSLVKQFGDPEDITENFLDMQDPRKLLNQKKTLDMGIFIQVITGIILVFLFYVAHEKLMQELPAYQVRKDTKKKLSA